MRHWMSEGLWLEELLGNNPSTGEFCEGDEPTMADCCLILQVCCNAPALCHGRWRLSHRQP